VDRRGFDAAFAELPRESIRTVLRACEHEHLSPFAAVDQRLEQRALAARVDRMDPMLDEIRGRVLRRDRHLGGVSQQRRREALDLLREGRGEHQALSSRRQQADDAADRREKAHVEHPVGLVEDEDLDRAEIERALRRVVEQPAGRRDDDVHAARERGDLRTDIHSAEQHRVTERQMRAVRGDAVRDLRRELARRRQNQRADAPLAGRRRRARKPREDRQRERGRLAGAGLSACEEITAFEHVRNRGRLNGRRGAVAAFGDGTNQPGRKAERIE